jgi:ceramide glucosyltransferase
VLLEPDFIEALFAASKPKVGLISTAVIMTEPETFAAELESAFINSYLSRWMLWGDSIGLSFAFGKTLMWQREILTRAGGMAALSHEAADEISAAKTVRFQLRMKQRLAQRPVAQPIGRRDFPTIWRRQVRWARLRRTGYPGIFAAEPCVWGLVAFIAAIALTIGGALPAWALAAIFVGWYALEGILTIGAGLPFSPTMPLAWIVRDFLVVPGTWLQGWTGKTIEWRGATISAARPAEARGAAKPE